MVFLTVFPSLGILLEIRRIFMDNLRQKLHRLQALELWLAAGGAYEKFEMAEKILIGYTAIGDDGSLTTTDGTPLETLLPTLGAQYPALAAEITPPPPETAGNLWHKVGELREQGLLGPQRDKPQS